MQGSLLRLLYAGEANHEGVQPVLTLSEHPGTPSPVPTQPRILAPVLLFAAFFFLKLQLCYFILIHQISLLSSCLQAEAFSVLIPSLPSQFFSNSLGRKETKPKKLHRDSEFSSVHGLIHHMLVKHQKTPNRNRNYFLSTLST